MDKDKFYFVLKDKERLFRAIDIELSEKQTVVSNSLPYVNVHATNHQPTSTNSQSVFQVTEDLSKISKFKGVKLFRVFSNQVNPMLQDLGVIAIDISVSIKKLKPFERQSYADIMTLDIQGFGKYLTIHLFQGKQSEIVDYAKYLITTKKAYCLIPTEDGFRTHSPKYPVKYGLGIFDNNRAYTVGLLILGHNNLNEKVPMVYSKNPRHIKFVAFNEDGRRKHTKDL